LKNKKLLLFEQKNSDYSFSSINFLLFLILTLQAPNDYSLSLSCSENKNQVFKFFIKLE